MIKHLNSDASRLSSILADFVGDDHWSPRMIEDALTNGQREVWGWENGDGQIIGFCILGVGPFELEVEMIAVEKHHRRQGIARGLLEHAQQRVCTLSRERLLLEVRESNTAAQKLYTSMKMLQDGMRKGYYTMPDGGRENALLYSWQTQSAI